MEDLFIAGQLGTHRVELPEMEIPVLSWASIVLDKSDIAENAIRSWIEAEFALLVRAITFFRLGADQETAVSGQVY